MFLCLRVSETSPAVQKHSLPRLSLPRRYFSALFCQVHFPSCPLPLVYFPGPHHQHHQHLFPFAVSSADHGRSPEPVGLRPEPRDNEMPTPYAVISGLPGCQ